MANQLSEQQIRTILSSLKTIEENDFCTFAQFIDEVKNYPLDYSCTVEELEYVIQHREQLTNKYPL